MVTRGLDPVGTGRQVELAAMACRESGAQVHVVVTTGGGTLARRMAEAGFVVHRLSRRPVVDCAVAVHLMRLTRRIRMQQSDAIVAWGRSQAGFVSGMRPFLPKTRMVCHLALPPRRSDISRLLWADVVIAGSATIAAACGRGGLCSERIVTIPPAADAAAPLGLDRGQLAERVGLDPARRWTLCVAPLVPESRLERLFWAIDQLGVVHRGLEHVVVGGGPLRQRLLRRARMQQITDRLQLVPHLEVLPDLLRHAAVVWQSGEVACGGAILDGMSVGLPAVAVESDAALQFIADGKTGRVVPAHPESEFPRRVFGILEDDDLAGSYAVAARSRAAADFSLARMSAAFVAAVGG